MNEEGFERLSDSDIAARYGGTTSTPYISQQADLEDDENNNDDNF